MNKKAIANFLLVVQLIGCAAPSQVLIDEKKPGFITISFSKENGYFLCDTNCLTPTLKTIQQNTPPNFEIKPTQATVSQAQIPMVVFSTVDINYTKSCKLNKTNRKKLASLSVEHSYSTIRINKNFACRKTFLSTINKAKNKTGGGYELEESTEAGRYKVIIDTPVKKGSL